MYILPLDTIFDENLSGAKGFHLSKMKRAGFPVPEGFVISKKAFEEFATNDQRISSTLTEEISMALSKINASHYMVRSSAIGEDSSDASFAGQLKSFISTGDVDEILQNVLKCWESYFATNVTAYEANTGKKLNGMGVVVQQLIDPDYAGVTFTRSHLDDRQMLTEYVKGHGENLVSGHVTPHSFQCAATELPSDVDLPFDFKIGIETAAKLELFYKKPLDIEWVVKNNSFHVVQARPITTTPQSGRIFWSNTNVNENYPEAISTLLYSIARDSYYHYFKNLSKLFRISAEKIRALESSYTNIIGTFGCRIYYNMSSIHEVISESPFSKLLSASFDNFVGYAKENTRIQKKIPLKEKISFLGEFIRFNRTLEKNVRAFEKQAVDYAAAVDKAITLNELRTAFHGFIEIRMHSWFRASLADFFAMAYHGALGKFCALHYDKEAGGIHNKLVQAIPGIVSNRPIIEMYKIKTSIRRNPAVYDQFKKSTPAAFYTLLTSDPSLQEINQQVQNYLNQWGFRCSGELMLTATTYTEQPEAFIALLQQYDSLPDADPEPMIRNKFNERKEALLSFIKKIRKRKGILSPLTPIHILILHFLVKQASGSIAARERARLKQALLYFKFKQVIQQIGKEFAKQNILENADDILFLRYQEIAENLTTSDMLAGNLKERIALRKNEFQLTQEKKYPDDFYSHSGKYPEPDEVFQQQSVASTGDSLRGLSACGGKIRGRAKVLHSVMEASKLEKGDILITRQTDPGWVVVFPLISGLIVERGGMLSHGAIVSREFGIPAIVGVDKVTEIIKDNDLIFLNADTGEITFHD